MNELMLEFRVESQPWQQQLLTEFFTHGPKSLKLHPKTSTSRAYAFNPWLKDFLREKILGLDFLDARDPKSWQEILATFCQDSAKTFL
jgi:hypothetical protein